MAIGGQPNGYPATFDELSGQSWTTLPSPPTGPINGVGSVTNPTDLSCTSPTFCVAVGGYALTGGGEQVAVVDEWNGRSWTPPQTAVPLTTPPGKVLLSAVSCVTESFCMAVGERQVSAQFLALTEMWNGTTWTTLPTPSQSGAVDLQAVSCTTNDFCFTEGTLDPPSTAQSPPPTQILVEAWNGSSWSTAPSPPSFGPSHKDLDLSSTALDCTSSSHCLSVWSSTWPTVRYGGPTPANAGFEADSQLWNGSRWIPETMPNPSPESGQFNVLNDESCIDASDCVVVGTTTNVGSTGLIESYDGSTWTLDPISNG